MDNAAAIGFRSMAMQKRLCQQRSSRVHKLLLPSRLLVGMLILLSACSSSGETHVLDSQPEGITLLYKQSERDIAGVTADEHCRQYGKLAKLREQQQPKGFEAVENPGSAIFVFACVDPAPIN